jgi:hypothetical protein
MQTLEDDKNSIKALRVYTNAIIFDRHNPFPVHPRGGDMHTIGFSCFLEFDPDRIPFLNDFQHRKINLSIRHVFIEAISLRKWLSRKAFLIFRIYD